MNELLIGELLGGIAGVLVGVILRKGARMESEIEKLKKCKVVREVDLRKECDWPKVEAVCEDVGAVAVCQCG